MNIDVKDFIYIKQSKTADIRSCDYSKVTKDTLIKSTIQHIDDVQKGINYFIDMLKEAGESHDYDKLTKIHLFHKDFINGFETTEWWDCHKKISRHHLQNEEDIHVDVNLIDIIEMIVDGVMAGKARTGDVYMPEINTSLLERAFINTFNLLKDSVKVKE